MLTLTNHLNVSYEYIFSMEFNIQSIIQNFSGLLNSVIEWAVQTDALYQLVVIFILYVFSLLIAKKIEPWLESYARNIKGYPGLLRVVISILRRSNWICFTLALGIVLALITNLGWRDQSYLIYIALLLSLSWLIISVATQSIRNRSLSQLVALFGWAYVAITILGITENTTIFLEAAGFSIGDFRISLLLVFKVFVFLGATLWIAISIGNFFDNRIQKNDELTPSLRVLIGKILKITLIFIAVMVAVSGIGIDLTVFSVLSGAIGVGIGFGLQKVVSNFISGLIILADRSIKPGDTISLGDTFGWIRELRARFVSVVTRDGREFLIPNEDFITREVINWSFSDDLVRLDIPFGVSYDSDPHQVTELTIAAILKVDRVLSTQKPVCWLTGFGDSSLDFILRFWIKDPQNGLTNIRGQVLLALWDTFKENGINIPYPHREVIMKTPVAISNSDKDTS